MFGLYYKDRVRKGGDAKVQSKRIPKPYRDNKHLSKIVLNVARAVGAAIRAFVVGVLRVITALPFVFSLVAWGLWRFNDVAAYLALFKDTGIMTGFWQTFLSWLKPNTGWDVPKGKPFITIFDKIRRLGIIFNYMFSIWRGIFTSKYNIFEHGIEILDDENYMEWLTEHGLDEQSEYAPIVINNVDISYNFPDGDNSERPRMAAGSYLRWSLRMFLNLEAFVWSFEAGTGETVIAPLYHVLRQRGVRFAFFNKVTALRLSEDGRSIGAVEIDRQAELVDGVSEYDPLERYDYTAKDERPKYLLGWPAAPRHRVLKQGADILARQVDLESYWAEWPLRAPDTAADSPPKWKTSLVAGVDYDQIVLAISVGAVPSLLLPDIDLMCSPPPEFPEPEQAILWRDMVSHVPACATQQLQIWLDLSTRDAGGQTLLDQSVGKPYSIMSGSFVAPFNGQADFSHLIRYEGWDQPPAKDQVSSKPHAVWYFSGALALRYPMPGDPPTPLAAAHTNAAAFDVQDFPARQKARVWDAGVQFLQATGAYLLPNVAAGWEPLGLDFSKLKGIDRDVEIVPPAAAATRSEMTSSSEPMSDDVSMKALSGTFEARADAIFAAGLDMALHCNGDLDEARAVASVAPALAGESLRRAEAALAAIRPPEPFDLDRARADLAAINARLGLGA